MGTTPTILRNAVDATSYERYPNSNYSTQDYVSISNLAGWRAEYFLFYSLPFPVGVTILNAKLTLFNRSNWSGSVPVSVQRVAAAWSASRLTWNLKPGVTGSVVTVTKSAPVAKTQWDFDVTALMQSVSNGAKWYGFKVTTTSTVTNWWLTPSWSDPLYRPILTITWADNPKTPTALYPSGGRAVSIAKPVVRCNFTDISGDTTMQAINVQINPSNSWTAPAFDSGTVLTSVPELDLAATAYAGMAVDETVWWRVRVQDGAGLWSGWSLGTTMVRRARATLTLTNPPSGTPVVQESTPPISWTFAGNGRTQKAYQVTIANGSNSNLWLWTSGKITSTTTTITIPDKVLTQNNIAYNVIVSVWDEVDREATSGDPIPTTIIRQFTFSYSATVSPVTGFSTTAHAWAPYVRLDWSRSTMPDKWNIYRDGKLLKTLDGAIPFISGTAYQWWDLLPQPRTPATYSVIAVVNGVGSTSNPTSVITLNHQTVTLSDDSGTNPVLIYNYELDQALQEVSAVFAPAGGGSPIIITQAERGYAGKVSGILDNVAGGGPSAQAQRNSYKQLIKFNGQKLLLTIVDDSFECIINNATFRPIHDGVNVIYAVSFDFYQTDYVP